MASGEELEFFALQKVLEVRKFSDEFLKKDAPSLHKLRIVVILHLHVGHINSHRDLLRDGRDVAARPPLVKSLLDGFELVKAPLTGPLALLVFSCDCVLGHLADLDGVSDCEGQALLLGLILVVLSLAFHLLALRVECQDLLNQISLGDVCTLAKISIARVFFSIIGTLRSCRVLRHLDGLLAHEVCPLGPEAHWHLLLGVGVAGRHFGNLLRLVLLLLFVVVREKLR